MNKRCKQGKHRWVDDGMIKIEAGDDVQPKVCKDCGARKNFVVALSGGFESRLLKWIIPISIVVIIGLLYG